LLEWILDTVLGLTLLWLAWRALNSPDLFKAIVLFISFGLLMALVWVRLNAPDVALAEAAIGAGLTGALLLAALARLRIMTDQNISRASAHPANPASPVQPLAGSLFSRSVLFLLLSASAVGMGYAVWSLPSYSSGLSMDVATNLDNSGVSNPVTAVLLNFRGYDTMLEMIVLLLAVLGVWSLGGLPPQSEKSAAAVLEILSRFLTPVFILAAAYLLWVGADAPGGAFQAGSVLGAAGVLLLLSGWRPGARFMQWPLRLALTAGAGAFILLGLLTLLFEKQLLAYPVAQAGRMILLLESLATVSIAVTLAVLFLGASSDHKEKVKKEEKE
jgi:multisubunit Na+/H+ antiporter MnhB subunit